MAVLGTSARLPVGSVEVAGVEAEGFVGAAAPISGCATDSRPPVSTTTPASTASSTAAAASALSERDSRSVRVRASDGTWLSSASRLAESWSAQNGLPRDCRATSRR